MHQSLLEGCVYVGRGVIIAVHVDDLLCVGRCQNVEAVLADLQKELKMKTEKVKTSMTYLGRKLTRT